MRDVWKHTIRRPLAKRTQRVPLGRTASWGLTAGEGTPSQAMALSTSASPATGSGRRLGVSPAPKAAPPSKTPAAPGPPCTAAQRHQSGVQPFACDALM